MGPAAHVMVAEWGVERARERELRPGVLPLVPINQLSLWGGLIIRPPCG